MAGESSSVLSAVEALAFIHSKRVATPNDLKLSDRPGWRDRCVAGGRRRRAGSSGRDSRAGSLQRMVRRCVGCGKGMKQEWEKSLDCFRLRFSVRAETRSGDSVGIRKKWANINSLVQAGAQNLPLAR